MIREKFKNRYFILASIIVLMGLIFIHRLLQLQIVDGEEYRELSEKRLYKSMTVKAPRGKILDRYGRPIATNRTGYSVQITKTNISQKDFNNVLLNLVNIIEANGDSYFDTLPISYPPFEFTFSNSDNETAEEKEIKWKEGRNIPLDFNAAEVMENLREKFKISEEYSDEELRKIVGIRYEMQIRGFSSNTPFILANDISQNTYMQIEEQHLDFPGVNIVSEPIRYRPNGNLAVHIIGRVGAIYPEEYQELKDEGYGMNDTIGKDGIEKVMEKHLKGKDGKRNIEQNIDGKLTRVLDSTSAIPGNDVLLTIDMELQKVAERALEETITRIRENAQARIRNNPRLSRIGEDANSGAVVAMDVNTGGILAMASYPSYDPENFNRDYLILSNDPLKPLFNRAISGAYPPASTFKMLTAVAGLEENIITPETKILDRGKYTYYSGYHPICYIYSAKYGYRTHGYENVSEALRDSCNYFFYDVGRRLGIEKLEEYGKMFGLGEFTGIELPGEQKGIFAGKTYREMIGQRWWPGETLGAAIGQMHIFTPIQLASFVSTLANGGTRYEAHLIKKVKTYDDGKIVQEVQPKILNEIKIEPKNLQAVLEGMRSVTQEDGTASHIFRDFPIDVAGKTGTAEISSGTNNGVFVGFAPYDNPQIAVAVIIEHGASGGNTAPIAREIFETYLKLNRTVDSDVPINQLVE